MASPGHLCHFMSLTDHLPVERAKLSRKGETPWSRPFGGVFFSVTVLALLCLHLSLPSKPRAIAISMASTLPSFALPTGTWLTAWRVLLLGEREEARRDAPAIPCALGSPVRPVAHGPCQQIPFGALGASHPPPLPELHPSVHVYYKRGRTTQQYVTGVIITSQTPIMPSAADLSPFLSFNHPPASLTLTEQQHRPCDLSARGHDL